MNEENNDLFEGLGSFLINQDAVSVDSLDKETKANTKEDEPKLEDLAVSLEDLEEELASNEEDADTNESDKEEGREDNSDESKDSGNSSIYKTLSELLKEEGIVEETFEDKEALFTYFKTVADNNVQEWKESLPKEIADLINNYEEGVPFDELLQIKSNQIRLDSITEDKLEDNLDLQKNLVKNFYKEKGFSETKIEKMVSKALEADELEDEAKEALAELKELENKKLENSRLEAKKKELEEQKAYTESINKLNETINQVKEIIPGVKIDDKTKKELFNMLTKPAETRGETPISQVMLLREKNPLDFELKLNYYAKLGLFDENPKFDVIMKKSETKAVSKLEKQLEEEIKARISKSSSNRKAENPDEDDIYSALKTAFKK